MPEKKKVASLAASEVLTIRTKADAVLPSQEADAAWHELENAFHTHKVLSGSLGGLERLGDSSNGVAVVYYNGIRIVIPLSEMFTVVDEEKSKYTNVTRRLERIVSVMMGCEIDFIIRGMDVSSRSVVASRRDAMLRKQKTFYLTPAEDDKPMIYQGRVVQARVMGVVEKAIRIEVFGVECTINAKNLSWQWIGDARELFKIGDVILVRVTEVNLEDSSRITIAADPRSVTENPIPKILQGMKEEDRYAGEVTDVRRGTIYLKLHNGTNAIAHSCLDKRMPVKKDQVSLVVTHINYEQNVVIGIISRIIRSAY